MLFWEEIPSRDFFSSLVLEWYLSFLYFFDYVKENPLVTSSSRFSLLFKEIHSKVTINVRNGRVIGVEKWKFDISSTKFSSSFWPGFFGPTKVEHLTNLTKRIKCASSSKTLRVVSTSWLKLFKMSWPNAF